MKQFSGPVNMAFGSDRLVSEAISDMIVGSPLAQQASISFIIVWHEGE